MPERFDDWETLKAINSPESAIRLDENASGLPPCKVWTRFRPLDQELEVQVDPVQDVPTDKNNQPADLRVELGERNIQDQASTFSPWEIPTQVIRTERGSVIYKFSVDQINPENLQRANIAFTSIANRRSGAIIVENFKIDY